MFTPMFNQVSHCLPTVSQCPPLFSHVSHVIPCFHHGGCFISSWRINLIGRIFYFCREDILFLMLSPLSLMLSPWFPLISNVPPVLSLSFHAFIMEDILFLSGILYILNLFYMEDILISHGV